jgi:hypothetical protein
MAEPQLEADTDDFGAHPEPRGMDHTMVALGARNGRMFACILVTWVFSAPEVFDFKT